MTYNHPVNIFCIEFQYFQARHFFPCTHFSSGLLVTNKLVEPAEHLVVPFQTVSVIQHPMVLVREDDQTAWNAEPVNT